jgi:hypothetical protein
MHHISQVMNICHLAVHEGGFYFCQDIELSIIDVFDPMIKLGLYPQQGGSGIEKKYAMPIFFVTPVWLD